MRRSERFRLQLATLAVAAELLLEGDGAGLRVDVAPAALLAFRSPDDE